MNDDMMSWVLWSQCAKSFPTHDLRKTTLFFSNKKRRSRNPKGESTRVVRTWELLNRLVTSFDCSGNVTGSDQWAHWALPQGALELVGARWLRVGGGLEEHPCVVGGVVVWVYIVVVQWQTVLPGTTLINVADSEINYLLTNFAFGVAAPRRYLAKTPSTCGPFSMCNICPQLFFFLLSFSSFFVMLGESRPPAPMMRPPLCGGSDSIY